LPGLTTNAKRHRPWTRGWPDRAAKASGRRPSHPHSELMVRQEAVARVGRGKVLILALVSLVLADAIVWTVILFWP
jgi:hypothetical protein